MSNVQSSRAVTDAVGGRTARSGAGGRTRLSVGLLAAAAAFSGMLTFGVSRGVAASPLTDYTTNFTRVESPDPQLKGRWSERLATVPDLNGDGKNEILIADLNESFGGFTTAGRVYMQDGATRRIMYSIDSPEIQSGVNFGFFISVIGDVNGDGKADFAAGTDAQNIDSVTGLSCTPAAASTCNYHAGKAWVFSGANGQMLYPLNDPDRQAAARFGSRIGRAGDVNGDGIQDIIVGASGTDNPVGCAHMPGGTSGASSTKPASGNCRNGEGAAYIFSGKDGSLLRTLNLPAGDRAPAPCDSSCGGFGLAVQGPGDVGSANNGAQDGVVDQLVDASSFNYDTATGKACTDTTVATCNKGQGAEYLFSGKDGALIRRTDDPAPQAGATFGFQDAEPLAPGDVNGDGVPDYYANGFGQDGPPDAGLPAPNDAGRAWVFSGKTGALLYEVKDPTPSAGGQFGWSMARTDYNKDGTPDLYVGQSPHHVGGSSINQSGGTYVFNGRDGSLLKSLELPASDAQPGESGNNGSNLGWTSIAPGDLNGDGEPDYVAGAPFQDVDPTGVLPLSCQASTPGCIQDLGREYFFYSNVPASPPGTTPPGVTPPGITPPGITPPVRLPRANLPGLRLTGRRLVRGRRTIFIVRGALRLPPSIPGSQRSLVCRGSVSVAVGRGHKTGGSRTVRLRKDCSFSVTIAVATSRLGRKGRFNVRVRFHGNAYVNARSQRTNIR